MKQAIIFLQINCFILGLMPQTFSQENRTYYSTTQTEKVYSDLRIAVYQKEKVYRLDLRNQDLTTFPEDIYLLYNLKVLVLDGNQISTIDFKPEMLPNLTYLSIKNNKIHKFLIPNHCLKNLKELYLDFNKLIKFPEILNEYIELTTLSLNNNFIRELPLENLALIQLQHLHLDSNPLKNAEQAFNYSTSLERLSLYSANLKAIPNTVRLNRLTKLIISSNPLDLKLINPNSFPRLEYLDISYCNLYPLESTNAIFQIVSLKYVSMDDCKLKRLSPEISQLKKLREISLIRNNLSFLPDEFYSLKLKLINLEENPLSESEKKKIKKVFKKADLYFSKT